MFHAEIKPSVNDAGYWPCASVEGIESIPNRGKPSLEYHLSAQVGPFIDVEYAIGIAFELLKRTPADQGEDCR